jgi:hypothetical protein
MMNESLRGVIRGKLIELENDPGIEPGSRVSITLHVQPLPAPPPGWRADQSETAGGMLADSWNDEDDRILQEIHSQRGDDTRPEVPQ